MKYVYVVRGSEDGNIGAFTSKKKAMMGAVEYCSPDDDAFDEDVEIGNSFNGMVTYVSGYGISAYVEKFILG